LHPLFAYISGEWPFLLLAVILVCMPYICRPILATAPVFSILRIYVTFTQDIPSIQLSNQRFATLYTSLGKEK
jgi:hypothetical protein